MFLLFRLNEMVFTMPTILVGRRNSCLNCDSYLRNKSGLIFLWPFSDIFLVYLALDGKRTADTIDKDYRFPPSSTVLKSPPRLRTDYGHKDDGLNSSKWTTDI